MNRMDVEMLCNKEYFGLIATIIESLKHMREAGKEIAANIIGQSLLKEDLFFCASVDRNMNLTDGFIEMLNTRNLTCTGALLRLQMDNCIRTYAAFIAMDKNSVIDCLIHGGKISDQVDKNGNKMTDRYMKKELCKMDSRFADVYDQASGYIHLSDKAFYQTVKSCDNNIIEWQIGTPLLEKHNTVLLEAADAFVCYTRLHYKMLTAVAESKQSFDREYNV